MKINFYNCFKSIGFLSVLLSLPVAGSAQYCTPSYSTQCNNYNMYINSFSTTGGTTNISNLNSGCDNTSNSFKYYSNKVHTGVQGTNVGFSFQIGASYPQGVKIYVDFNIDGDYDDAGEQVYVTSGAASAGSTVTGSFTIPALATPGNSRLRVRSSYSTTSFTACNAQSYGECEEYGFIIVPSCSANFPSQPANAGVCEKDSTTIAAVTANADEFQWQVNGGGGWVNIGNGTNYDNTKTETLTIKNASLSMHGYKYRLVATNTTEACSVQSDAATLSLVPTTDASVVIAAAPDTNICKAEEVIFTSYYTNGGSSPHYKWLKNGAEIPGEVNASLKIHDLDHGDYVQCLFISSNQCVFPIASKGLIFSVFSSLPASVDLKTEYHGGNTYTFTATPVNGGLNPVYYWHVNGKLVPGQNGNTYTSETLNPYDKITVDMLTSKNCAEPKLSSSRQATTGVASVAGKDQSFLLSPNPNRGSFTVQAELGGTHTGLLVVTNSIGQVVYKAQVEATQGKLLHDVNLGGNSAPGIYFIRLETGDRQEFMKFTITD